MLRTLRSCVSQQISLILISILLHVSVAMATTTADGNTSATSFPVPFDLNQDFQRTIYVASNAPMDGNGSKAAPFNNIRTALEKATPGTLVRVAEGNYPPIGSIINLQGTAQAPIAVVADGQVIIDGSDKDMALHMRDARYFILDGITIRNSFPHGINIDDGGSYDTPSEFIILRNMHIQSIGDGGNSDCVKLSGVDHFYVEHSEFEGCNMGEGIDMVGCHHGVITGNYFHDMPRNATNTKGGSANILIHGNRFENIGQRAIDAGGYTGDPYFRPINAEYEGSNIQIISNIIVRSGISAVTFTGCNTCVFANNTIIEPRKFVARIIEENRSRTPGHHGYFLNNIIVFKQSQLSEFVDVRAGSRPDTFTFGWNLWYALDNPDFSGPVYNKSIPPEKNPLIQQDPKLSSDYRTLPGSPVFGMGTGAVPRGLVGDFDRNAYNNPPAIGAFAAP
jgi:hypothetical protein